MSDMLCTVTMLTLARLTFLVFVRYTHVVSLSLCNTRGYLEVKEGRDDNKFVCNGLTAEQTATWLLISNIIIADCPPLPSSCTPAKYPATFKVNRTSQTDSDITVVAGGDPYTQLGTSSLTCLTSKEDQIVGTVACLLDVVYPSENPRCQIQFSGDTWTVTGSCTIAKARSARNSYGCYLYQTSEMSRTAELVGSYTMDLIALTQSGYYSGTCNLTSFLPPEGRYSYSVMIIPGEVNVSVTFNGSNVISPPRGILTHGCPRSMKEGDSFNCSCFVDDPGSPPGLSRWNNSGSNQLFLAGVQRKQSGANYVCILKWNTTIVQSVTYTLVVTYPPTQLSFKLDSDSNSVTVPEKSTVTMFCQSDGRPTPAMTIIDVSNGNRLLASLPAGNITPADQVGYLQYALPALSCDASGKYRCSADNGFGRQDETVTLYVECVPRLNEATSPAYGTGYIPAVTYNNKETQISFQVTAYPTPQILNKMFLGSCNCSSIKAETRDSLIKVSCAQSAQSLSSFICTIIVDNVLSQDAGFYEIVIGNSLGQISFTFEVKVGHDEGSQSESAKVYNQGFAAGLGTGIGVTVAVVVILLVTAVLWAWRRSWTLPCRHVKDTQGARSGTSAEDNEAPSSSLESSGNTYDALYTKEVGEKSAYASLNVASKSKGGTEVKSTSPRIRNLQTEEAYSSIN